MNDIRFKRGEVLSADKMNRMADRLPGSRMGAGVPIASNARTTVLIKNVSGSDRDVGDCLVLGNYIGHESNVYDVEANIVFEADDPTWHTDIARLVILAEPIPDGEIGLVVVSGVCTARLSADTTEDFVMIDPTNTNKLKGATGGVAKLLASFTASAGGDFLDGFADDFFDDMLDESGNSLALIDLQRGSDLWHFKATGTHNAGGTPANLLNLDGTEFAASISVVDRLNEFDDIETNYVGVCRNIGNKFVATGGPCVPEV